MADQGPARVREGVVLLGKPRLGTAHAVGQALAIGPMASAFLVAYLMAGHAGRAAPLVVLIAFVGALALGATIAMYARRFAGAGVLYEYLARNVGRMPGIFATGAFVLVLLPLLATTYLALGLLVQDFSIAHLGLDPGFWIFGVIAGLAGAYIQFRGIKLSARTQLIVTGLSVAPLVVLAVAILAEGGDSGHTVTVLIPEPGSLDGLFRALIFGAGLFGGFEMAAALGEESRDPHRTIPRAIFLTLGLGAVFYFLVVYAGTIGFGVENVAAEWGSSPLALLGLGERYVGRPLAVMLELGLIVDFFAILLAFGNGAARVLLALARDGFLPRALAARSRHETPIGGILACLVSGLALIVIATPLENKFDLFEPIFVGGGIIDSIIIAVIAAAAFRFGGPWWRYPVVGAGIAWPLLGLYGQLNPFPTGLGLAGLWIAALVVLACLAWVIVLKARRPESVSRAASYALEPES